MREENLCHVTNCQISSSALKHVSRLLAYFGFSFLRNHSADFQSTKKGSSPLRTIYSRFLNQHFISILTFSIFTLFEAVFCYAAQAVLTLETSSCLVFLMPSVQSPSSHSLRSPCQMWASPFIFSLSPICCLEPMYGFFLALWIFLSEATILCEHDGLSNLCA